MFDWLNSRDFTFLAMTLAVAALYGWRRRRLKRTSEESWKTFHAACTTSSIRKTAEPEWITALRAWAARDACKPGLNRSASEEQIQPYPSWCDVTGQAESRRSRAASAENVAQTQPYLLSRDAPEPAESTARQVADPEVVWVHCKPGDRNIAKLRHWLVEGKTNFNVITFPPADHEWERIHEGQGVLEVVTEQEAKFRFHGANQWMFFPDFSVGYDRKRKRPLIRLRERR